MSPQQTRNRLLQIGTVEDDIILVTTYNNSRTSFEEIRAWFEKAAADEGYPV